MGNESHVLDNQWRSIHLHIADAPKRCRFINGKGSNSSSKLHAILIVKSLQSLGLSFTILESLVNDITDPLFGTYSLVPSRTSVNNAKRDMVVHWSDLRVGDRLLELKN